eukprot:SAG31_NODE_2479_length_5631_cov_99.073325_7_plen_88_part_00
MAARGGAPARAPATHALARAARAGTQRRRQAAAERSVLQGTDLSRNGMSPQDGCSGTHYGRVCTAERYRIFVLSSYKEFTSGVALTN